MIAAASTSSSVHFGRGKRVICKSVALELAFLVAGFYREAAERDH